MKLKTVNIPFELYHNTEEQLSELGFKSVDEYVTFILQELLKEDVAEKPISSPDEEAQIEKRLRDLGYVD